MSDVTIRKGGSQGSDESSLSLKQEIVDGKNKQSVKCQFCPSIILLPGAGVYVKTEMDLPLMMKRKQTVETKDSMDQVEVESLNHFWEVQEMYTFENVGFSHTIGDIKYLACADCEIGPIGYCNSKSMISYVAMARVCHM